mmetsp:Transcript_14638/g.31725  ORF Transcript_14638/g.31725 Transcript_14638/m.31725 type:complete len:506 (-) Transcript_14638:344-1861(-)
MAAETLASQRHRASYGSSYRGKRQEVDETLFGATKCGSHGASTVISKAQHQSIQSLLGAEQPSVLTASELNRMKLLASGEFERQAAAEQEAKSYNKEQARLKAQARMQKMRQLEEERKSKVPPSDVEAKRIKDKAAVVSEADRKLAEELDDVKKMNQMMLYAKVVTIRDKQVNEKKIIEKERKEEEQRLDMIMEVERLKALKMYEERESRRAQDNKMGAQVIIDQIKSREKERMLRVEMQDQERAAMIAQNEEMKEEERKQMVTKAEAGQKLLNEVALSNSEQIALKKLAAEEEKREERRIQAYIRDKERREQELAQDAERLKVERERETARLRAQQEKLKDKQAELDALRAKRAVEEAERTWRKKEREEAERQVVIEEQLCTAREAQKLEKERRLIEQAKQEKEEFSRILRVQRDADTLEKDEKRRKQSELVDHQSELRTQIVMNGDTRKKNRIDFLQEGNHMRKGMENDRLKLEKIQSDKLASLHRAGVPEKYTVDLSSKKFT